ALPTSTLGERSTTALRRTSWLCTPCSAWIGAKPSYSFLQASKSATRWRTRAVVLVMRAPFWSRCLAAKKQASGEAHNEGDDHPTLLLSRAPSKRHLRIAGQAASDWRD